MTAAGEYAHVFSQDSHASSAWVPVSHLAQRQVGISGHRSMHRAASMPSSQSGSTPLGYTRGLASGNIAQPLFERPASDIHKVISNMKSLQQREREQIALEMQARERANKRPVKVRREKDLCIFNFQNHGARLIVKRWSKGFVLHEPKASPLERTDVGNKRKQLPFECWRAHASDATLNEKGADFLDETRETSASSNFFQ